LGTPKRAKKGPKNGPFYPPLWGTQKDPKMAFLPPFYDIGKNDLKMGKMGILWVLIEIAYLWSFGCFRLFYGK
jgi:hypothetical protein